MKDSTHYPRLLPEEDLTEQILFEIKHKGWLSAVVELVPGQYYLLNFYDPVRLQQEVLDVISEQGSSCFAEPGLVVVPEVTLSAIEKSLLKLRDNGYFNNLVQQRR